MARSRLFPLMILVASACVLGLAPILVRLSETGPAAAGFWRFVFAIPMLLVVNALPGLTGRPGEGAARPTRWMLLAGVFFAMDLSFWHYGIVMTSVANATVLCNLTPVVVSLFAWIVWKQAPARLFLLALALAMGGAFAMAAGGTGHQGSNPRLGDLFSLSVSLWYSGYFLTVKKARLTAGAMRVTLWATLAGLPILGAVALSLGEEMFPARLAGWAACAAMGVMHVAGQGGVGVVAGQASGLDHRRNDPDPARRGGLAQLVDIRRDADGDSGCRGCPGAGGHRHGAGISPQDADERHKNGRRIRRPRARQFVA